MSGLSVPRCPDCGDWLEFRTDWIGRVTFKHEGPCVPLPDRLTHDEPCCICTTMVTLAKPPRGHQRVTCSELCRLELKRQRKQAQAAAVTRFQIRQKAARLATVRVEIETKLNGLMRGVA